MNSKPDRLQRLYEWATKAAIEEISMFPQEDFPPRVMAVWFGEDVPRFEFLDTDTVISLHNSFEGKDMLMAIMQRRLQQGSSPGEAPPHAMVHLSEVWTVPATERVPGQSLADNPARQEALLTVLHTLEGSVMGICPITREGGAKRVTFTPLRTDAGASGRLFPEKPGAVH